MTDEWGPWIEHDGKGCPCVGMFVHMRLAVPVLFDLNPRMTMTAGGWEGVGFASGGHSWRAFCENGMPIIVRYRIRKPRALNELIDMVENLPAPTERVEA